ncbi:MAG: Nif11-like leader peptide family RiPP precursor [Defluviitaleaceae bacterium]|nr:Nif11-like leader peptide family RiPP precursor [Defluviitaleaceae bacterium]
MNTEGLERFFSLLAENQELQAKVKDLGGDVNALADYARTLGYDVSPEGLQEYQDKAREVLKGRLRKKLEQQDVSVSPGAQAFYTFMKLAETDEQVAKRMEELATGTPEELIAYGLEKGFVFDRQDMLTIGKDILEPSDELSDEELEMAAGGTTAFLIMLGIGAIVAGGALVFGVAGGAAITGAVLGVTALIK